VRRVRKIKGTERRKQKEEEASLPVGRGEGGGEF